jgi:TetR/AcrR family transcriptional regulator, cholesterol catabolism regulator
MARPSSRSAILRVFAEHVAERGYAETSLADVAAELGLSKGTILHHFGSKEALLGEVHLAYFGRRLAEADYVAAHLSDPVHRLVAMVYALLAAHRDDRAASLTCLRELVRYSSGEVGGDLAAHVRGQRARYTQIVVDIVASGGMRTADPRMTALHVFGMCNYAWTWYRPDGPESVEHIAGVFVRDLLGEGHEAMLAKAVAVVRRAPGRVVLD